MSGAGLKGAALLALWGLAGCVTGLQPYQPSEDAVVAVGHDTGIDAVGLADGDAAIVYDPDGCQGWIIDDGVEGYSGRRFDPVSGLPVCNDLYPPGTIVGDYQSGSAGIGDYVPMN